MDGQQSTDKRPKSYYVDYSKRKFGPRRGGPTRGSNASNNARYKEVPDISFGHKGFLITSIDEVKSYLEMRHIIEQIFHDTYDPKETGTEVKDDLTTEEELEAELKHLRVTRPFKQVKTYCRNSIFINILSQFNHIEPTVIVDHFFCDLAEKREMRTKNTNRVLPILDTFRSSISCAKESVAKLLDCSRFEHEPRKYFIEFQTRGNYKLESEDKQKMIEGVAETVTLLRPNWKVCREDTDYMIILVALKHVCCLTVVKNYFERSKYNVIEFCKDFQKKGTEDKTTEAIGTDRERSSNDPE